MHPALIVVAAYLIGSVSFAVVASRLFALPDPHSYGSGNPGASNVLRTGNKAAAALTLAGDGAKGWFAVWLAQRLAADAVWAEPTIAAAALAVFLGHLYPVFHRFAGGKGVATAAGVLCAFSPWVCLLSVGVWLPVFGATRISSIASLAAATAAPLIAWALLGNGPRTWVLVPIVALLAWRHRANIEKLLAGKESRFGRPGGP
jgi:glycerol-3-phosphate acyltransferase PlsY